MKLIATTYSSDPDDLIFTLPDEAKITLKSGMLYAYITRPDGEQKTLLHLENIKAYRTEPDHEPKP